MTVIEREAAPGTRPVQPWEILRRAAYLLEEFGWCQFYEAEDEYGLTVEYGSCGAARFCMHGAMLRAVIDLGTYSLQYPFMEWLGGSYWLWNDEKGRTKEEVVARLRDRADELEKGA